MVMMSDAVLLLLLLLLLFACISGVGASDIWGFRLSVVGMGERKKVGRKKRKTVCLSS
jgi:hypothetical protein